MAIRKQIDISVDAKQAISQMDELGSSFEDVFGEVTPLNTKIGEMEDALYQLAQAGDTSSKEFKDLSRTVGDYKKVIIETDMQVDAMAQTGAQNLGGAIEGVSGAFAVGTGMMGAFGVESEAVNEALLRVQSAMAITQGIQSIREGAKAFRGLKASIMATTLVQQGLNAVMKANPIGAVVTVIAALGTAVFALTGGFSNLKEKLTGVTAEQEMMSDVTAKAVDNIIDELAASEKLQNVLEDETINREDKIKAVKDLQKQYPNLLSNIDTEKTGLQDINKALKLNTKLLLLKAKQEATLELQKETIKENVRLDIEKQTGDNVKLTNSFNVMFKGFKNIGTQGIVGAFTDLTNVKKNFNEVTDEEIAGNEKQITAYEKFQNQLQTQIDLLEKEGAVVGNNASVASTAAKEKIDASREVEDAILANREDSEAKEQEMNMIAFQRFKEDTEKRVKNKEIEESEKLALIEAAEEKARQKRNEISQKYTDDINTSLQQAGAARIDAEKKFQEDREALIKDFDARNRTEEEQKLFLLKEKYNSELLLFEGDLIAKAKLKAEYDANVKNVEDESENKTKEERREKVEEGLQQAANALNALSELNAAHEANQLTKLDNKYSSQLKAAEGDEVATKKILEKKEKEADKIRRKAFESNKKLQIASALVTGIQSAMSAYSSLAGIPVVGPFLGAAAAAASAITTGMQIQTIKNTQFEGSGSGSVPLSSGSSNVSVPQFNVVGNSPQNQLAQSLGQGQDQPIQAFVVAGDVTTAQGLERNIIQTASL